MSRGTMVLHAHSAPERARVPIVVAPLALSELVLAGLGTLLEPFHARVRLAHESTGSYDIALVEPALLGDHWRPPLDRPVVALARERHGAGGAPAWGWRVADIVGIDASADELVRRFERVYRRDVYGAPLRCPADARLLNSREAEILTRICRGSSNKEIAEQLHLSPNSIKSYIRTGYRKMEVSSRSQALLWGLERGYGSRDLDGRAEAK